MSAAFLIGGHICAVSTRIGEFEDGQRWLLGGGLGTGMLCLWIYSLLFRTEDDDTLLLSKYPRNGMRLVVAVILAVLPETHEELNTVEFMAIVMSLFVFVTLWETIGGLAKGARVYESWDARHRPKDDLLGSEELAQSLEGADDINGDHARKEL